MTTFQYKTEYGHLAMNCHLEVSSYEENNNYAIQIFEDEEYLEDLTINLGLQMPKDMAYIKPYMLDVVNDLKIGEYCGTVLMGRVYLMIRFNADAVQKYEKEDAIPKEITPEFVWDYLCKKDEYAEIVAEFNKDRNQVDKNGFLEAVADSVNWNDFTLDDAIDSYLFPDPWDVDQIDEWRESDQGCCSLVYFLRYKEAEDAGRVFKCYGSDDPVRIIGDIVRKEERSMLIRAEDGRLYAAFMPYGDDQIEMIMEVYK